MPDPDFKAIADDVTIDLIEALDAFLTDPPVTGQSWVWWLQAT